ncbi:MAG: hypothetical protein K2L98_03570, partial [Bacilli bacterium]|nr:hypothetical protein [Bacilli bacterium]
YIIRTYRLHINFDMITLEGFDDINKVLPFKGLNLFVKRSDLGLDNDDYLMEDLIGMNIIIDGENFGIVKDYNRGQNSLLHISYQDKNYYIPLKGDFIESVNLDAKEIKASIKVKELIL